MEKNQEAVECPVKGKENTNANGNGSASVGGDVCPVKGTGAGGDVCPVKHDKQVKAPPSFFGNILNYFGGKSTPPTKQDSPLTPNSSSSNPEGYNTAANDLVFGHQPQPGQKVEMSQKRTISSIPKSDFTPAHQPGDKENWVYPSQQQYYNAMKRKGYNPAEEDVAVVLQIHNIVNEKGWSQIKEWEALRGCTKPKLKQFEGRPQDVTPKAYLMSLMGYALPFDRHDWVVDSNGSDVRYVIDFYKGKANPSAPIAMHLDVRPAVDNPYAVYHRLKYNFFDMLSIPKISPPKITNDDKDK